MDDVMYLYKRFDHAVEHDRNAGGLADAIFGGPRRRLVQSPSMFLDIAVRSIGARQGMLGVLERDLIYFRYFRGFKAAPSLLEAASRLPVPEDTGFCWRVLKAGHPIATPHAHESPVLALLGVKGWLCGVPFHDSVIRGVLIFVFHELELIEETVPVFGKHERIFAELLPE